MQRADKDKNIIMISWCTVYLVGQIDHCNKMEEKKKKIGKINKKEIQNLFSWCNG